MCLIISYFIKVLFNCNHEVMGGMFHFIYDSVALQSTSENFFQSLRSCASNLMFSDPLFSSKVVSESLFELILLC